MRRLALPIALAALATLVTALAPPALAAESVYQRVLHVYEGKGLVPSCVFTSAELQSVLANEDTYGQEYYADFTGAVQSALTAQASGACAGGGGQARRSFSANGAPPLPPGSPTGSSSAGIPAPIAVMAVLALLVAAAAALGALARRRAWEPQWAASARHALAELRYRAGAGLNRHER